MGAGEPGGGRERRFRDARLARREVARGDAVRRGGGVAAPAVTAGDDALIVDGRRGDGRRGDGRRGDRARRRRVFAHGRGRRGSLFRVGRRLRERRRRRRGRGARGGATTTSRFCRETFDVSLHGSAQSGSARVSFRPPGRTRADRLRARPGVPQDARGRVPGGRAPGGRRRRRFRRPGGLGGVRGGPRVSHHRGGGERGWRARDFLLRRRARREAQVRGPRRADVLARVLDAVHRARVADLLGLLPSAAMAERGER